MILHSQNQLKAGCSNVYPHRAGHTERWKSLKSQLYYDLTQSIHLEAGCCEMSTHNAHITQRGRIFPNFISIVNSLSQLSSGLADAKWLPTPRASHRKIGISHQRDCVAVCCSVLQCAAVCCSVLQCVAVCCSGENTDSGTLSTASSLLNWLCKITVELTFENFIPRDVLCAV